MKKILCLVLACSGLVCSAVVRADETKTAAKIPAKGMLGTWKVLEFHDDGGNKIGRLGVSPNRPERVAKLVVKPDEIYVLKADGRRDVLAGLTNCAWTTWTTDDTKSPKQIDVLSVPRGENKQQTTYWGIYDHRGSSLKICYAETPHSKDPVKERPTEFKSDGANNLFLCEFESDQPQAPAPAAAPVVKPKAKQTR